VETLENFLSSSAFEKMAREYHAKYKSASIMQSKEDEKLLEKVENAFSQIFRLLYLFDYVINKRFFKGSKANLFSRVLNSFRASLFGVSSESKKDEKVEELLNKISNVKNSCKEFLGKDINFYKDIDENQVIHKQCLFCLLDWFIIPFV